MSRPPLRGPGPAGVAVGTVAVLAAALLLVVLLHREQRLAGTNLADPASYTFAVPAGERLCVDDLVVPKGTASVLLSMGTFHRPGPPTRLTLETADGYRSSVVAAGYRDNSVARFEVARVPRTARGRLCLLARGRIAPSGELPGAGIAWLGRTTVAGRPVRTKVSVRFMRPGAERTLALLPAVARRAAQFGPGFIGPWFFYLLPLLWAGLGLGAYRALARVER